MQRIIITSALLETGLPSNGEYAKSNFKDDSDELSEAVCGERSSCERGNYSKML